MNPFFESYFITYATGFEKNKNKIFPFTCRKSKADAKADVLEFRAEGRAAIMLRMVIDTSEWIVTNGKIRRAY